MMVIDKLCLLITILLIIDLSYIYIINIGDSYWFMTLLHTQQKLKWMGLELQDGRVHRWVWSRSRRSRHLFCEGPLGKWCHAKYAFNLTTDTIYPLVNHGKIMKKLWKSMVFPFRNDHMIYINDISMTMLVYWWKSIVSRLEKRQLFLQRFQVQLETLSQRCQDAR